MPEVQRPAPAYVQIATHYRDTILSGELLPGDQLPPINTIAEQWHVSERDRGQGHQPPASRASRLQHAAGHVRQQR